MGSNISQHSAKGLKGRRARSSGDLCNGETKSQTESSVCGSVVGDVMGWNRSLPNHLDGNRHLADYSRVNNNYGDFGTYRSHPKGGRGLRYRVSKSGKSVYLLSYHRNITKVMAINMPGDDPQKLYDIRYIFVKIKKNYIIKFQFGSVWCNIMFKWNDES